jgi:hypothetical protein
MWWTWKPGVVPTLAPSVADGAPTMEERKLRTLSCLHFIDEETNVHRIRPCRGLGLSRTEAQSSRIHCTPPDGGMPLSLSFLTCTMGNIVPALRVVRLIHCNLL